MGLILDSSVVIVAEPRGDTIERLIQRIVDATGDQDAALSAVGLTELVHGIFRPKQTNSERAAKRSLKNSCGADRLPVHHRGGKGGRQARWRAAKPGIVIPLGDLLITVTDLSLGYSVLTVNPRHFQQVPGLTVVQL